MTAEPALDLSAPPTPQNPQQQEMPLAVVHGQPVLQIPQDLYIPPDALEVILDAFEGPLDLLLYLIRRQNLDILDIPVAEITRQYHDRYRLPVMHTETNLAEGPNGDEAVVWLRKQWANALRIRNSGIPLLGFTWYSLTDQLDWDTALREANGHVNPLGLYDLDRRRRRVGDTFAKIVAEWSSVLPTQSESLVLPVLMEDAT